MNQTCLDGLYRYPHALDAAIGQAHPDPLKIGAEHAFVGLHKLKSNTAALFALTLVDDFTTGVGSFSCNCADS